MKYSDREKSILALLPKGGKRINTVELMKKKYGKNVPFHGRIIIIGTLRSLMRKVVYNKEPFRIKKSERRGPHPIEFWIEGS